MRIAVGLVSVLAICAVVALPASAKPTAHGQVIRLAPHPGVVHTNTSTNWFGYNQGSLSTKKLYHSIVGVWFVPTATQHQAGQAEHAADWIGIGGGCVNSSCTVTDSTLIQTGTEDDVSSGGTASYSAWWELIPAPSITIPSMIVHPGDEMGAEISETIPNSDVWNIHIVDVTQHESFTKQVPYTSSHDTAEWIEETPLIIGSGLAALPNLTDPNFDHGMVDGGNANLNASQEIDLINSSSQVIGAPSSPDSDLDGFGACAWATSCTAPAS